MSGVGALIDPPLPLGGLSMAWLGHDDDITENFTNRRHNNWTNSSHRFTSGFFTLSLSVMSNLLHSSSIERNKKRDSCNDGLVSMQCSRQMLALIECGEYFQLILPAVNLKAVTLTCER